MPYSHIVFIKLFIEILDEDDRFLYQLNESQQLLYLKMLLLAGKTGNSIPTTYSFIKNTINYNHEESCFKSDIKRLIEVFPKLKQTDKSYYFENFEELHNFIKKQTVKHKIKNKELQRNSKGTPKECERIVPDVEVEVDKDKEVDKDIKKNTFIAKFTPPTPEEATAYAKEIGFELDGEKFVAHYEASGWMRNKTKITNWKACVKTWKTNRIPKQEDKW